MLYNSMSVSARRMARIPRVQTTLRQCLHSSLYTGLSGDMRSTTAARWRCSRGGLMLPLLLLLLLMTTKATANDDGFNDDDRKIYTTSASDKPVYISLYNTSENTK